MSQLVRTHLATYLGDLAAIAGVALLLFDAPEALRFGAPTPAVVADIGLAFAGLLGHRLALARWREAPTLSLGLLVTGSLGMVWLTERWWIAAAGGIAAAAVAPHFVVPRRAAVWLVAGLLLTVPGVLVNLAAGSAAAVFVLGVGLLSVRLADRLRGTAAHQKLELAQSLETERFRTAELTGRVSRYESEEQRDRRRSLLHSALARHLGAIEAIARSIVRDLEQGVAGSAAIPLADAVQRSMQRAEQLARLAGGGRAREHQTTLALVWSRVRDLIGGRLGQDHHLTVDIPKDLPPVVGNGESWVQILTALLDNAVEAMPRGGVIRVRAASGPREGFVRITISDAGCGISPDVLPHVMEPFYTSRAEGGAEGLGLAMVASVVEAMEGEIRLSSKVGEGTTVEIDAPIAATATAKDERAMRLEGAVLLADDDREVRRSAARLMESFGLQVVEADSGTVARAHLMAQPERFRIAVLDVVMPGTPVAEIVAGIRELRRSFPVLLISGYDTMHMVDAVLALGGVRFLRKPFTREELYAALGDLLSVEATVAS